MPAPRKYPYDPKFKNFSNPDLPYEEKVKLTREFATKYPKVFNQYIDKINPDPYRGTRKMASMLIQQYPERFPGATSDQIVDMMQKIAMTESKDKNIPQMKGGPGRGYFQIETTTAPTALKRYQNYQDILSPLSAVPLPKIKPTPAKPVMVNGKQVPTASVMNLSKDQQAMLALSNIAANAKDKGIVDVVNPMDTWLNYHWAGSAEQRPERIKHWTDTFRTTQDKGGRLTKEGKKIRKYGPRPDYMNQNPSGMTTGPITQRSIGNTPGGGYMSFGDGGSTAYKAWYKYNTPEGREGFPEEYSSYDYQRYYNDAVKGLNPMEFDEGSQHFPDTYKYPWHPSFSDESIYYINQKETPALSYNTKADWKEYLRSKKADGGWTGYPDHTMYSSAMEQFDDVRRLTKYADGGKTSKAQQEYIKNLGRNAATGSVTPLYGAKDPIFTTIGGAAGRIIPRVLSLIPSFTKPVTVQPKELKEIPRTSHEPPPHKGFELSSEDLEPYISRTRRPATREEEVFESFLSPKRRAELDEERTTYYDNKGNIIPKPKKAKGGPVTWSVVEDRSMAQDGLIVPPAGMFDTGVQRSDNTRTNVSQSVQNTVAAKQFQSDLKNPRVTEEQFKSRHGISREQYRNRPSAFDVGMNQIYQGAKEPFKFIGANPDLIRENPSVGIPQALTGALTLELPVNEMGLAAYNISKAGLRSAGKALGTESGLLSNAWRLNPKAYQYNLPQNTMWRGLGKKGMEDAVASSVFRSKQNVIPEYYPGTKLQLNKSFGENPYFTPEFNTASIYGDRYIAEVPRDVANWRNRYGRGKTWSQVADRPIPIDQGRILQKDWWQGYKPIETPSVGNSSYSIMRTPEGQIQFLDDAAYKNALVTGKNNVKNYLSDPRYKAVVEQNQQLANRLGLNQTLPIQREMAQPSLYEARLAKINEPLSLNDPRALELDIINNNSNVGAQYARTLGGEGSLTIPRIYPPAEITGSTEHEVLHHIYPNLGEGYPSFTPLETTKAKSVFKPATELRKIEEANNVPLWYLDDVDELVPNSFDLARGMGIEKFQSYPGKEAFQKMLDSYKGSKSFIKDALKLETNRDYKRAWDMLSGVRLGVVPPAILLGTRAATQKKKQGGKVTWQIID